MSKLYGAVTGDRGKSTRASSRTISTWVQTAEGRITVDLNENGVYCVYLERVRDYEAYGPMTLIDRGNMIRTLDAQAKEANA